MRVAELPGLGGVQQRQLVDRRERAVRVAVAVGSQARRIVAAAGRDEIEPRAAVRVVGETAVARRRADRDHGRRRGRVRELRDAFVAGGRDDHDTVTVGVAIALMMSGMSLRGHARAANSRLRLIILAWCWTAQRMPLAIVLASPSPHASSTRTGMIDAPYASPVKPEVVVGRLGELAGDERSVALAVERVARGLGLPLAARVAAASGRSRRSHAARQSGSS